MIPIVNKPARVTNKTATAIDHILTNSYTEKISKTVILVMFQIILINFHRRITLFIPTKGHLINNLFSILKETF